MDAEQAWQSALGQLQMEMPKASFDTWVRDTQIFSYDDGLFTIGVRNAYARDWLGKPSFQYSDTPVDGYHEPDSRCGLYCQYHWEWRND